MFIVIEREEEEGKRLDGVHYHLVVTLPPRVIHSPWSTRTSHGRTHVVLTGAVVVLSEIVILQ